MNQLKLSSREKTACPLCGGCSEKFFENKYFCCTICAGIFMHPEFRLGADEEKSRYESHNNDVTDIRYQKFVSPIVNGILHQFTENDHGLDFGAGTGPVISSLLEQKGFQIVQYDPFFSNNQELLSTRYDYIACCEVVEHFYEPANEFTRLRNLLKPGGKVFCMTLLFDEKIDFAKWFYKSDPTHVFFYQPRTFEKIVELFSFKDCRIDNRLIELSI